MGTNRNIVPSEEKSMNLIICVNDFIQPESGITTG